MKCLKPSRLIDWVNYSICNGSVQIKSANYSRQEAQSLADFKCCRCSLVNTIPQCHDDNISPDTLYNSGAIHLKRVTKKSRILLAENLMQKIIDICETQSNIALLCLLFSSLSCFLEQIPRGGKRQRSFLCATFNKRNQNGSCH